MMHHEFHSFHLNSMIVNSKRKIYKIDNENETIVTFNTHRRLYLWSGMTCTDLKNLLTEETTALLNMCSIVHCIQQLFQHCSLHNQLQSPQKRPTLIYPFFFSFFESLVLIVPSQQKNAGKTVFFTTDL